MQADVARESERERERVCVRVDIYELLFINCCMNILLIYSLYIHIYIYMYVKSSRL